MQIRDDRGRVVSVQAKLRGRDGDYVPLTEGLIHAAVFTVFGVVAAVFVIAAILILSVQVSRLQTGGELLIIGGVLCVGPAVSSLLAVFFTRRRREEPGSVLNCRACGYSLAELPQEADGCRVCPECGAASRGESVATPDA